MIYSRRRFAIGMIASLAFSGWSRAKESLPLDAGSLKTGVIVRGTGYERVIFDGSSEVLLTVMSTDFGRHLRATLYSSSDIFGPP